MRRLQLVELHETRWFPGVWRDLITDFLAHYAVTFRPYAHVVELLARALRQAGTTRLVDLGAGGGCTALGLKPALDEALGAPVTVVLTDKYPNLNAFAAVAARFPGEVEVVTESVDATSVPATLDGFRTLFTSFHHFEPQRARAILANAARSGRGIGVFEYTERRPLLWTLPLILIPALIWCVTPFMRPLTWRRVLWTYLLPVVPLVAVLDGVVSVLRSYSPDELLRMVEGLDLDGYSWRVGRARSLAVSRVTYLIGLPGAPGVPATSHTLSAGSSTATVEPRPTSLDTRIAPR